MELLSNGIECKDMHWMASSSLNTELTSDEPGTVFEFILELNGEKLSVIDTNFNEFM